MDNEGHNVKTHHELKKNSNYSKNKIKLSWGAVFAYAFDIIKLSHYII